MVLKVFTAFIAAASADILASSFKHRALRKVIVSVFGEFTGFYLELLF